MTTILLRLNENTQSVETITFFHHKERAKPTIFWTRPIYLINLISLNKAPRFSLWCKVVVNQTSFML